jgi:hypothetical protein
MGSHSCAASAPVTIATTPGTCRAAVRSMFTILECAYGDLTSAACSMPGSARLPM